MAHSKYLGFLHVHLTFLSGRAFRGFHSVLSPKIYLRHVPEVFAVAALERCHSPTVISSFRIFISSSSLMTGSLVCAIMGKKYMRVQLGSYVKQSRTKLASFLIKRICY